MAEVERESRTTPSAFLALPAEIRVEIYKHVIGRPRVELDLEASPTSYSLRFPHVYDYLNTPANKNGPLLRVCKTVGREATPLLYERTHFVAHTRLDVRGCRPPLKARDWIPLDQGMVR